MDGQTDRLFSRKDALDTRSPSIDQVQDLPSWIGAKKCVFGRGVNDRQTDQCIDEWMIEQMYVNCKCKL